MMGAPDPSGPAGLLRQGLAARLDPADADAPIVLAVSGGVDSTALMLVAAATLAPARLVVVHVHHGMQVPADAWAAQVRRQARALGLRFRLQRLDGQGAAARRYDGLGPEGWARRERYRTLAAAAREVGARAVVTAHHRDDQIETHLLQAARGAGDRGLAAMAPARLLAEGGSGPVWLLRPFLALPRERLRAIVDAAGWQAVDDPSNDDPARRRSRLRADRRARLDDGADARAARAAADAALLTAIERHRGADARARRQAIDDLEQARVPRRRAETAAGASDRRELEFIRVPDRGRPLEPETRPPLQRPALALMPPERRAALWRLWLEKAGLGAPTRRRLDEIDRQMVLAEGAEGRVRHDGMLIVRHRDRIGLIDALPVPLATRRIAASALLAAEGGSDDAPNGDESGFDTCWMIALPADLPATVEIGPGRAGERWRPPVRDTRARSRLLRKLWQEGGIPSWLRPALPVLRDPASGRLLAAAPFGRLGRRGRPAGAGERVWCWRPAPAWRPWLEEAWSSTSI